MHVEQIAHRSRIFVTIQAAQRRASSHWTGSAGLLMQFDCDGLEKAFAFIQQRRGRTLRGHLHVAHAQGGAGHCCTLGRTLTNRIKGKATGRFRPLVTGHAIVFEERLGTGVDRWGDGQKCN